MSGGYEQSWGAPRAAPVDFDGDNSWRQLDNSVNAVSFGFVATAILISMFLVMALFERFLRSRSSLSSEPNPADPEAHLSFNPKLDGFPSPKVRAYSQEVSVLMPGDEVPSFIGQPCPAERIARPLHPHSPCLSFASSSRAS